MCAVLCTSPQLGVGDAEDRTLPAMLAIQAPPGLTGGGGNGGGLGGGSLATTTGGGAASAAAAVPVLAGVGLVGAGADAAAHVLACGGRHTLLLGPRGGVLAWGWNKHGQARCCRVQFRVLCSSPCPPSPHVASHLLVAGGRWNPNSVA